MARCDKASVRARLVEWRRPLNSQRSARGRVTACTNQKGGVGKTTTVVNLAAYLALSGTPTLVIDLDPQGNATSGLGSTARPGSVGLRRAPRPGSDWRADGSAPPSTGSTSSRRPRRSPARRWSWSASPARERRLAASLAGLNGRYARVLVDCPPSLGLLTVNALTAADGVLIPIQTEYYALEGLSQLVNTIRLVREG